MKKLKAKQSAVGTGSLLPLSNGGRRIGQSQSRTRKHWLFKCFLLLCRSLTLTRRNRFDGYLLHLIGAGVVLCAGINFCLSSSVGRLLHEGSAIDAGCADDFSTNIYSQRRRAPGQLPPWILPFNGSNFMTYKASVDRRIDEHRKSSLRSEQVCRMPLFSGEYGYELAAMVPWAYYRHWNDHCGVITEGVEGTKYLYFFSKNHTIVKETMLKKYLVELEKNMWPYRPGLFPYRTKGKLRRTYQDLPDGNPFSDTRVHRNDTFFPTSLWLSPPFKDFYRRNDVAGALDRPLVVIFNKYTEEWGGRPVNFIPLEELQEILAYLEDTYFVVYIRLENKKLDDDSKSCPFGDKVLIRTMFPDSVAILDDLTHGISSDDVNLLIFSLAALSDHFVSVQGGNSVLASFFGGTNIILAKNGTELTEGDYTYYHRFSNATIDVVNNERDLVKKIKYHM